MSELSGRRTQTKERIEALRSELGVAAGIAEGKACVYATGSFGRGEASKYSDLDLFILARDGSEIGADGKPKNFLKRLDEICIKADLIEVTRKLSIPEFSGDGKYLTRYSVEEIVNTLGRQEDDMVNTFTARLLLLLESCPLIGEATYHAALEDVLAAYWRDYEDHKATFTPAFLVNDILRLWRTFCVNYEARTERVPDLQKAKGKLTNYKLKHSRLLTCYSALLYFLFIFNRNKTVAPLDALSMIALTPTQRIEWLMGQSDVSCRDVLQKILDQYQKFLSATNADEADLINIFLDREKSIQYREESYVFGDLVFEAINKIGNGSRLHRLIAV